MEDEPDIVFPQQDYPSDVELWLQDGVLVLMRVGTFGPSVELSPDEGRRLGLALQELAVRAGDSGCALAGRRSCSSAPDVGSNRTSTPRRGAPSPSVGRGTAWTTPAPPTPCLASSATS